MKTQPRKDSPSTAAIREQLEKIQHSGPFARSERMRRFLRYIVEQKLAGQADSLKEYSIALSVYDKTVGFDPRLDPIIRVEASRLRTKLREYYDTEGLEDPVVISLPKRSYKPQFRFGASPSGGTLKRGGSLSNAQRMYLKGRHFWNKRTPTAIGLAMECFTAAVSEKQDYALAHAGLGDCYASLAWLEALAPGEAWPKALAAAQSALRANPKLAQAHTTLGCEKALYQYNWQEAENRFRHAATLDDRYATAHHWYAMFCLAPQRRLEESLGELKVAQDLDPLSAIISCHLGRVLYFRRRYEEAISQLHQTIRLDPTLHLAYWHLGFIYAQISELERATGAFAEAQELFDDPLTLSGLGYIHALSGQQAKAEEAVTKLNEFARSRYVSPISFALIEVASNNLEGAFRRLQEAVDQRAPRAVHLKVEPALDSIKTDARFLKLLKGLNV